MAGLVPAIHVLRQAGQKDVDARHMAGHDVSNGATKRAVQWPAPAAIAVASAAARCMLEDISPVTVLCSSTAAAVEVTYSLTSWIAFLISFNAVTTSPEMPFRLPISM